MDKQNRIYTCNGLLISHKKEILIHMTMWMNFENIALSEISQVEKATEYLIPFT